MSGSGARNRALLKAFHRRDPRCRMCQNPTVIRARTGRDRNQPDDAVLCRWFPRDDPRNDLPPNQQRKRLTCYACAEARHAAFDEARPIEELWARSGRVGSVYFVAEEHPT